MKQEQQTQPRIINRPQLEKQVCPSAAAFPQPGIFFLKLTEGSEQPRSTRAGSVSGDRSHEMGKREPTFVEQKTWRNAVGADGRLLPGQAGCCTELPFPGCVCRSDSLLELTGDSYHSSLFRDKSRLPAFCVQTASPFRVKELLLQKLLQHPTLHLIRKRRQGHPALYFIVQDDKYQRFEKVSLAGLKCSSLWK